MWVDKNDIFANDKVREFKTSNPDKETHIRSLSSAKLPYPSALQQSHLLHQHALRYTSPRTMILTNTSSIDTAPSSAPIDIPLRPLIDDQGMVLPRTPPSPASPPVLLFNSRVETPASWPPSDDMNIETHTPPRTFGAPGSTPWAPVTTLSRDHSPFWPGGPRSTPEKGIDAVPVTDLGANPGLPIIGTPEYDYDLTSPPSPKGSPSSHGSSSPSSPVSEPLAAGNKTGCTKYCFDVAFTLHHHDHTAAEDAWTTATLVEERPLKHHKVWGYGMQQERATWERLDRWDGWEEDELDNLHSVLGDTLRNLTSAIQRRRWN
jgi:hypothetical protein